MKRLADLSAVGALGVSEDLDGRHLEDLEFGHPIRGAKRHPKKEPQEHLEQSRRGLDRLPVEVEAEVEVMYRSGLANCGLPFLRICFGLVLTLF